MLFFIIAVLFVNVFHLLYERYPLILVVSGSLAQKHHRDRSILISCVHPGKTAVAFFKSELVKVIFSLLEKLDLLADILKSCKHLHVLDPVGLCDGARHIRGNYG